MNNEKCCETNREADVPAAINELNENISRLESVVQNLWSKLDPVVRQEPTADNPKNRIERASYCKVSGQIWTESQRVDDMVKALERMHESIEV